MPYGSRAIFEAASGAGIIMSYDAFQTIINIGGELKNPRKEHYSWSFNFHVCDGRNLYSASSSLYWSS